MLERKPVDVALVDLQMPGMGGFALLSVVRQRFADVPVAVLTAYGTVPLAVQALHSGAADFLEKPIDQVQLFQALARLTEASRSPRPSELERRIVGTSAGVTALLERIERAANSDATVLIRGESGTGKELVAREVHRLSRRRTAPYVTVHCSALPEPLLESELFGHCRGAFTGADRERRGRVDLARGGTLVFDELGDISPLIQTKLLRLIQERTFERVGEVAQRMADVRFIAVTHRPLEDMVARGEFRSDLYYRLNVVPIVVPPLRERREDVPIFVTHFAASVARQQTLSPKQFTEDALGLLVTHDWPGNVRELRNIVERLVVLSPTVEIDADQVRSELASQPTRVCRNTTPPPQRIEVSRDQIAATLDKAGQNRALAARLLGVSRRTLYNRLREYGLD